MFEGENSTRFRYSIPGPCGITFVKKDQRARRSLSALGLDAAPFCVQLKTQKLTAVRAVPAFSRVARRERPPVIGSSAEAELGEDRIARVSRRAPVRDAVRPVVLAEWLDVAVIVRPVEVRQGASGGFVVAVRTVYKAHAHPVRRGVVEHHAPGVGITEIVPELVAMELPELLGQSFVEITLTLFEHDLIRGVDGHAPRLVLGNPRNEEVPFCWCS